MSSSSQPASVTAVADTAQPASLENKTLAREEWRRHWPLVLTALAGMSLTSVPVTSLGLFMQPLGAEFGWSRAAITSGLTIYAFVAVPILPLVGSAIDRWGSRRVAIPGIVLSSALFAAFSLLSGSLVQWWAFWSLLAVIEALTKTPVWTTAVSKAFVSGRGLALALTLCGTAVAQTFSPVVTQWLVSTHGWRAAYFWLGTVWGSLVLVLVLAFFFDVRERRQPSALRSSSTAKPALAGLSFREAFRNPALLKIGAAIFLMQYMTSSILVHVVPILSEHGIPTATAVLIAGSVGIAGIVGKLVSGWLLDRLPGAWVAIPSLSLPAISCLLLLNSSSPAIAEVAMILLGYVTGAQLQLCTYLTGRYAGLRNFGKIFGVMTSLMTLGVGMGPTIAGLLYDHFGSYSLLLTGCIPASLVCAALVARLGAYPQWRLPVPVPATS